MTLTSAPPIPSVKNEESDVEDDDWMFGPSFEDNDEQKPMKCDNKDAKLDVKSDHNGEGVLNLQYVTKPPMFLKDAQLKFARSRFDAVVDIYVGSKDDMFQAHECLLSHHSAYFLDLFRSKTAVPIIEPELKKLNPDFFEMFVKYMYSSQVTLPRSPTKGKPPPQYLFGAFYLADILGAARFKNAIVDQLARELNKNDVPSKKFVTWQKSLFSKIRADGIRKLITNAFFVNHRKSYSEYESGHFHADMKHETLKLALGPAKARPKKKDMKPQDPIYCATYHEHDAFNPQWTCKKEQPSKDPFKNKPPPRKRQKRIADELKCGGYNWPTAKALEDDVIYQKWLAQNPKKRKISDAAYVDNGADDSDD
jgi:hypothetical protein